MLETVLDDKETIKTENSLPLVYFQPVAEIISLLSRHTLNSLNSIENLISAILNTASITTSLSFELTRSLLVACFSGASNLSRSNQILHPFLDHYSNISIATLNHGFSLGLLLTLSTFHLASSTVKISIHASASMIHLLDGLFGSTDTSRLIASFVNLARREIDLDGTSFKSVILLGSITKSLIAYVSLKYMLMKYSRQDAKLNRLVDGLIHEKVNQTSNTAKTDRKLVHSFNDLNDNRSILVNWYNENDGTVIEIQETGRDDGSDIDEIMSFSSNLRENMPLVDDSADVINGGLIFNGSINTKDSDFVSDSLNDFGDQNLKTRFNLKSLVSKFKKKLFVEKQVLESTSSPEICTSGSFNINVEKQGRSLLFESQTETKRTNGLIKRSSRIQLRPNINQKLNDSELPLPSKTSTNSQHTALLESFLKYIKLSTASYGHLMMSMIGLSKISHLDIRDTKHSAHHYNFSIHSGIPLNCILYSSQDKNNSINHTILLDHSIKSIVMVFRGSFGVGDVLVDLTCTYKKHILNNKEYLFHDGMLKSALELLDSESIRLIISQMNSLKYALVLCGAGVASILALLLSKKVGDKFVTIDPLPKDFDIKVVAFGVPCCVDYDLSVYSKGLVQSVINGDDIISTISVGLIRDFLNVSAILVKTKGLSESLISRALSGSKVGEENLIDILRLLKSSMNSEKLYPPGDIYWIKSHSGVVIKDRVRNIVKRVEMHECLDVREMFAEPNFSSSMITDHSPAMYHNVLESLVKVVCKV